MSTQDIRVEAERLRSIAFDLAVVGENLSRLAGTIATEHVTEVDDLHDQIEHAHRRWWHRLIGIRWEMTGWSSRWTRGGGL